MSYGQSRKVEAILEMNLSNSDSMTLIKLIYTYPTKVPNEVDKLLSDDILASKIAIREAKRMKTNAIARIKYHSKLTGQRNRWRTSPNFSGSFIYGMRN